MDFEQHLTNYIDQISRGQHPGADSLRFTDAELSADIYAMGVPAFDWSLKVSKASYARFICEDCDAHLFPEEVQGIAGINYHVGCGGIAVD